MPLVVCSGGKIKDYLPSDFVESDISSLRYGTVVTNKYVQAKIRTKYILNTYKRPSIKLVLESCTGRLIDLHVFGPIAIDVDACSVGDTLVLTGFEVDSLPRSKKSDYPFYFVLDDCKSDRSVIWVLKASQSVNASNPSTPAKATPSRPPPSSSSSSNAAIFNNPKQSPGTSKVISYTYTLLKNVVRGTNVHVYGVVSRIKTAVKTSGTDFYMMVNIVDPSLPHVEEKFLCNMFNTEKDKLPTQAAVGDVIRIHRLKIQTYQGKIQGRNGPGCHWVLFQGSYDNRVASSNNYTLGSVDQDKVCELLNWWDDLALANQGSDYFNLSGLSPISAKPDVFRMLKEVNLAAEGTLVNLYAVVIYCRPVVRTVRSEYHLMMNITDQSLGNKDTKLTCNLFDSDQGQLPCQAKRGDVIRFQDLQIQLYRGKRQAVKGDNFRWILFQESFDTRMASRPDYVLKEEEKTKVDSMLDWWQEGPENSTFNEVVTRQYFNAVCQVILNVYIDGGCYRLLKVWDGTRFNGPIVKQTVAGVDTDKPLCKIADELDLVHDVFLFDNHVWSSQDFKYGDYIKLTNLHAAVVSRQVEMTLHGGVSYDRGVKRLQPHDRAALKLKAVLDPLISKFTDGPGKKDDGSNGASTSANVPVTRSVSLSDYVNPTDKELITSRKRPSEGPSEFESECKKQNLCGSSVSATADGNAAPSSAIPGTNNVINPSASSFLIPMDSTKSITSPECHKHTLPSSIESPPSSLDLSEKDRYYVEAVLARDRAKAALAEYTRVKKAQFGLTDGTTDKDSEATSSLMVLNEAVELSMGGTSLTGPSQLKDKPCSSRVCENAMIDKIVDGSNKTEPREEAAASPGAKMGERSVTQGGIQEANLSEITSSQESFQTAVDPSSPMQKIRNTKSRVSPSTSRSHRRVVDSPSSKTCDGRNDNRTDRVRTRKSARQELEGKNVKRKSARLKLDYNFSSGTSDEEQESKRNERVKKSESVSVSTKSNNPQRKDVSGRMGAVNEISSSQESYHTATNPSSPTNASSPIASTVTHPSLHQSSSHSHRPSSSSSASLKVPQQSQLHSPIISERRHLSLRSENIDSLSPKSNAPTLMTVSSQTIVEEKAPRSALKESRDNTVSSSGDSRYSIPNDRQPVEFDDEEISSSTDLKDSMKADGRVEGSASAGEKETIVTASKTNRDRKHFKLRTFVNCRRQTKLKARVRLSRYFPCTENMSNFVHLCCLECKYMVCASDIRSKRVAKCPHGCGQLQAHIAVDMWLSDGEYEIKAVLWGQNAIEFFQGVTPLDLLHKTSAKEKVWNFLDTLCPPDTKLKYKPLMECCVFSYVIRNKMYFQIFDTVIL